MNWEFDFLNILQTMHNPILDKVMWFMSTIGEAGIIWFVICIILFIPKKYRMTSVQILAAMLLTFIVGNLILKNAFHRIRPCWIDETKAIKEGISTINLFPWDYSFPSGHSMNGMTAAVTLFLCNKRFGIPAIVLALVIAFSRMYAYLHFPTDIIAGLLVGLCCAIITHYIFKKKGWNTIKC